MIVDGVVVKLDISIDLSGGTDDNPYKISVLVVTMDLLRRNHGHTPYLCLM